MTDKENDNILNIFSDKREKKKLKAKHMEKRSSQNFRTIYIKKKLRKFLKQKNTESFHRV